MVGGLSHILWKIKFMFQTTNQIPIGLIVSPRGCWPGRSGCVCRETEILSDRTSKDAQLRPFISYNCLFQWNYTFYKWGFVSTYNWYFGP